MWDTLVKTGGPWQIRSLIKSLVKESFPEHIISDSNTAMVYFSIMRDQYESSSKNTPFVSMYNHISEFVDGKITDNDLLKLSKSELNNVRSLKNFSSSVKIEPLNGESLSSSKEHANPKKWRTVYKTISFAIYTMVILFFIHMVVSMPQTTKDDIVDYTTNYINRYISTGEHVITLPPSIIETSSGMLKTIDKTPYVVSMDKRLKLDHQTRYSGSNQRTMDSSNAIMKNTKKVVSGQNYDIFTQSFVSDFDVKELNLWIDYMVKIINPLYAPVDSLKVIFSKNVPPTREALGLGDSTLGEYMVSNDVIFVKTGYTDGYQTDPISVTVHEMAHRAHLEIGNIGLGCKRAHAGRIVEDSDEPGICKTSGRAIDSESTREYLSIISDTVDAVIYLGIPNESMSYEEAVVYKKMIMDMRINMRFEDAEKKGSVYRKYWASFGMRGAYGMINYTEFWAEASASYLYHVHEERFPSRSWIQENDPKMYDLLEEMYSSAPFYKVD